ncbi:MAG: phage holin family protein [Clostridiaceae bacterium]|nr:phage holin family protein [Clostridiaceae bacterium]
MKTLIHLASCIGAIFLLQALLPQDVHYANVTVALTTGVILWLINILIRPIIKVITLPITLLTLGLFSLVINTLMVMLADYLVDAISFGGFLPSFFLALMVSVLQVVLSGLFHENH